MQVELPMECISQFVMPEIPMVPQQLAIHLRDVNLVYNQKNVLSDLSLDVPRGSMYGLLGPSGCGKTVLIRCILGTLKPTSGSIELCGQQPGKSHSIGYMPQRTALFPQLTIRETFNYFESIYGIEQAQLNLQCQSFIESLHLPTQTDQLVGLLRGDQKRRLSLAIALIHKPKLLILDEPTRGMDPLFRKSIWEYLIELNVNDHLTVLITSNNLEESKDHANVVGFMRHGHILAQDSPSALLDRFQMNTFEQVFLHLCTEAEDSNRNVEHVGEPEVSLKISSTTVESFPEVIVVVEDNAPQPPTELIEDLPTVDESQMDSVTDVSVAEIAIGDEVNRSVEQVVEPENCLKVSSSRVESYPDVVVLVEESAQRQPMDKSQMDSLTDIPAVSKCTQISAIVIKNIRTLYRNKSTLMIFQLSLPIVVVALFCLNIALPKHPIPVAVYDGDNFSLSDKLIYTLDPVIINQQYYPSWDEALDAFRMSKESTALVLEVNFSSCTCKHKLLDNIKGKSITTQFDQINSTCSMTMPSLYNEVIKYFPATIKKYWVIHPKFKQVPVLIEKLDHSSSSLTPGMISSIAFFSAIPLTCISLLTEKKNGLIERTLVSGVSYFHILLSHLIPQTVILFLQMMSLVAILFPLFGIPFYRQYLLAMSLLSLQSVCGICFSLFVSTISRDGIVAVMLVLGLFYLNLMLSGTVVSIGTMIDYVIAGYQFEVICAFSFTLILSGIFLLATTLMARFCL